MDMFDDGDKNPPNRPGYNPVPEQQRSHSPMSNKANQLNGNPFGPTFNQSRISSFQPPSSGQNNKPPFMATTQNANILPNLTSNAGQPNNSTTFNPPQATEILAKNTNMISKANKGSNPLIESSNLRKSNNHIKGLEPIPDNRLENPEFNVQSEEEKKKKGALKEVYVQPVAVKKIEQEVPISQKKVNENPPGQASPLIHGQLNVNVNPYPSPPNINKNVMGLPGNKKNEVVSSPVKKKSADENLLGILNALIGAIKPSSFIEKPSLIQELKNEDCPEELKCETCDSLRVKLNLSCGHAACLNCFYVAINSLVSDKSKLTLIKSRCEVCGSFPKNKDVKRVFGNTEVASKYKALSILKKCNWCTRQLDLKSCFFGECGCLDLCSECYLTEVYFGAKTCFVCCQEFENLQVTRRRTVKCKKCKGRNLVLEKGCRALHLDHRLCYSCCLNQYSSEDGLGSCLFCGEKTEKRDILVFTNFFIQKCSLCDRNVSVSEISKCKTCSIKYCDDCPHSC